MSFLLFILIFVLGVFAFAFLSALVGLVLLCVKPDWVFSTDLSSADSNSCDLELGNALHEDPDADVSDLDLNAIEVHPRRLGPVSDYNASPNEIWTAQEQLKLLARYRRVPNQYYGVPNAPPSTPVDSMSPEILPVATYLSTLTHRRIQNNLFKEYIHMD